MNLFHLLSAINDGFSAYGSPKPAYCEHTDIFILFFFAQY